MANITLSSGMRSNLMNLQSTLDLLNQTQNRLSTGLKVNSALDDPTAYFTALTLTTRASNIDSLKDEMGQAIQTIKAADVGITAITDLIDQAKGIAKKAQAVVIGDDYQTVTLADVAAGAVINIGGSDLTATAAATAGVGEFTMTGATDAEDAAALAAAINDGSYTIGGGEVTASADGAVVSIYASGVSITADSITVTGNMTESAMITPANEMATLQGSYNEMLNQIDNMVTDAAYKGKNLLDGDNLDVSFEGGRKITIEGFSAKVAASGLDLTDAAWTDIDDQAANLLEIESALTSLQTEASKMASNLGIITTREEFSTNIVNLLIEGADKLTLADMNEEGANMLALQTKQALAATALSLSAQASQSVLRLF